MSQSAAAQQQQQPASAHFLFFKMSKFIQGYTIEPANVCSIRLRKAFAHLNFPFIVKTREKRCVLEQTYKFKTEREAKQFKKLIESFPTNK